MKDAMLIVTQPKGPDNSDYTMAHKCNKEEMKKTLEHVLKSGKPKYIETDTKAILVLTRELINNSVVYFVNLGSGE